MVGSTRVFALLTIARAQQHYYYGPEEDDNERLATAAAKMVYGVGMNQPFVDGNKRTAFWLTRHFLNENGLGHVLPPEIDDEELADHLLGHGEGTHSEQDTIDMFLKRLHDQQRTANILDPIHDALDPRVWDDPASPEPKIKQEHSEFLHEKVYSTLEAHGYDGMERWLSLVFTGSLTTYQYDDHSDVDISLFVDVKRFPEWSRAELIGVMIENCDGTLLPGTPFPLQCFVVPSSVTKQDLYKPGLRSGYDLATDTWIVPPDKNRVHDVEHEMNEAYTVALENADKMDRLLRYEPDKAVQFWHQIHERRKRDQAKGKGDYAPSNITYKMLANRNLMPKIEEVSGEYLAHQKTADYQGWTNWETWNTKLMMDNEYELYKFQQQMAEQGYTPEQIRDWAIQNVLGPYNQERIQDAKEWNSIPPPERTDPHYEEMRDQNPQAADLYDNIMGVFGEGGPDLSDDEPNLIDPEIVNWNEIHHNIMNEHEENQRYEEGKKPLWQEPEPDPDQPGDLTLPEHWGHR
jgi:prophage maintenance system killer protein